MNSLPWLTLVSKSLRSKSGFSSEKLSGAIHIRKEEVVLFLLDERRSRRMAVNVERPDAWNILLRNVVMAVFFLNLKWPSVGRFSTSSLGTQAHKVAGGECVG